MRGIGNGKAGGGTNTGEVVSHNSGWGEQRRRTIVIDKRDLVVAHQPGAHWSVADTWTRESRMGNRGRESHTS